MFSFLSEITRPDEEPLSILLFQEDSMEPGRRYEIKPRNILILMISMASLLVVLTAVLIIMTPVRDWLPGNNVKVLQENARLNALRLVALEDSLMLQQAYLEQFRYLFTGERDSSFIAPLINPTADDITEAELVEPLSPNWADHAQPAVPIRVLTSDTDAAPLATSAQGYLSTFTLPTTAPVNEGFLTRGFNPRIAHYGVDLAAKEGATIHALGEGYVVFADWTHDGGYVLILQHANGYLTMYKHCKQLLKQVGDRVNPRDPIAITGNSGEITTGPHLHLELWHDGLAQDPQQYFTGW